MEAQEGERGNELRKKKDKKERDKGKEWNRLR